MGKPTLGEEGSRARGEPPAGLCGRCLHVRRQGNARGSVFLRCGRADEDPRFPRYPPLPVRECAGFEPEPRAGETDRDRVDDPS